MRIGILPGSFDPLHNGHLEMALSAIQHLNLDKVIFVPSGVSPNKRSTQRTPGTTRRQWIQKVLDHLGNPHLEVSGVESQHNVPTYTLDSILHFRRVYPAADDSLFLLVGTDTEKRMKKWPGYKSITGYVTIETFGREGCPGTIPTPEWPVSSTLIRSLLKEGEEISHLVPAPLGELLTAKTFES